MEKEKAEFIFNNHYARNKKMIFKMARNLFKTDSVNNVVEEILAKISNELMRKNIYTKPEKELVGWFYTVSRNLLIDKKRKLDSIMEDKVYGHDLFKFKEVDMEMVKDNFFNLNPVYDIYFKEKSELVGQMFKDILTQSEYDFIIFYCDNTEKRVCRKFRCTNLTMRVKMCRIKMKVKLYIKAHYKNEFVHNIAA